MATIEIIASATVIFRSALVGRKSGINSSPCSAIMPTEPMPGKIPIKLAKSTNRKIVATNGKIFRACSRFSITCSTNPSTYSIIVSKKFWIPRGTKRISRVAAIAKIARIIVTSHAVKSELVKGIPKMLPMCSGIREM